MPQFTASAPSFARRRLLLLAVLIASITASSSSTAVAQARTGFLTHTFTDDQGEHRYVVWLPPNYNPRQRWPVMMFLHGAGERGRDGRLPITVGLGPVLAAEPERFPFVVVFPQNENTEGRILPAWNADTADAQRALRILDEVEQRYSVDKSKEILTGWSMGGYGVWSLAAADPSRWHAVVPLAGGGDPAAAEMLKDVPIWAFHGVDDSVVPIEESRTMIDAIEDAGGSPRFTVVTGAGHDVWKVAYEYQHLVRWMWRPESVDTFPETLAASDILSLNTKSQARMPFEPAVEIPNAVGVRIGNESLKAIADSVPRLVSRDSLSGSIPDIHTSTTAEGYSFGVTFANLYYSGSLTRARVQAYREGRLNIQLGLEDINLTIGSTYVDGPLLKSASAGPIDIVIGQNRPVWISFDVRPYVRDRRLRLELLGQRFDIPEDNWFVSGPAGVSTRGLGMTAGRVSSGLVDGLYARKGQIESEVLSVVPSLIAELETHLVFDDMSELLDNVWPLPVYHPQVRLFPTDAAVDSRGVSVVFGIAASDVTLAGSREPLSIVDLRGPRASQLSRSDQLELLIHPEILEPLTNLLVKRNMARIHVQDIPYEPFSELASYETLVQAIPDLKRFGENVEIRSQIILTKPLDVELTDSLPQETATVSPAPTEDANGDVSPGDLVAANREDGDDETTSSPMIEAPVAEPTSQVGLKFGVPSMVWQLSVRPEGASDWQTVGQLHFDLTQAAAIGLVEPNHQHRVLKMDWVGHPDLQPTGGFVEGYEPTDPQFDTERLAEWLRGGWQKWTQRGPASESAVPDIDFGFAKLRLNDLNREGGLIAAEFTAPKTRISNQSEIPLVYEVKDIYSRWGGPYTLPPGKSHVFDGAMPLGYRSSTAGVDQKFTLPAGAHLEFFSRNPGETPMLYQARGETNPRAATASR